MKGRGLIASRNFKMGDLIFKERAVATIRSQGKEAGLEILSQLNQMTADERNDFYNLTTFSSLSTFFIVLKIQLTAKYYLSYDNE